MKILIIGGTQFIGIAQVEIALARGHEVTIFNRGKTNADLFPQVEKLIGDRDGNLEALKGRRWDVVIDNCGYVPRVVKQSAELLSDAVDRYIFISSISVFADLTKPGIDENSPLATLEDETTEVYMSEAYGGLKVLCEKVVEEAVPGRTLIIRPGLIVGPNDPTNRFTYWPARIADTQRNGGEVLAPDSPEVGSQVIDSRDLGAWTIDMAEKKATGIYNATGPDYPLTLGKIFDTSKKISGSDVNFTWVSEEFLLEQKVEPFSQMPLWVPREMAGFDKVNVSKAINAGLKFRPLEDTIRDTLAWETERHAKAGENDPQLERAGLSPAREAELLAAWQAKN
jgi:2'-hydroxyisoflavone reductase